MPTKFLGRCRHIASRVRRVGPSSMHAIDNTHLENVFGNCTSVAVSDVKRVPTDLDRVVADGETAGRRRRIWNAGLRHEPLDRVGRFAAGVSGGQLESVVASGLEFGMLKRRGWK